MEAPGQSLGHYRIVAKLGAGGMGEVWRAIHTQLPRDVNVAASGILTFPDPYHSGQEGREITIGHAAGNLIVFISHCLRGERV